jgi:hypothetical protein
MLKNKKKEVMIMFDKNLKRSYFLNVLSLYYESKILQSYTKRIRVKVIGYKRGDCENEYREAIFIGRMGNRCMWKKCTNESMFSKNS